MSQLVGIIIWSIAIYFIVSKLNKTEDFQANPWVYVLWSVLFGFVFSIALYLGNMAKYKGNNVGMVIGYIVAVLMFLVNLSMIF